MSVKQRIWALVVTVLLTLAPALVAAQPAEAPAHTPGGEANLVLPDLAPDITFLGMTRTLAAHVGLAVCALGLLFGFMTTRSSRACPCTARCERSRS